MKLIFHPQCHTLVPFFFKVPRYGGPEEGKDAKRTYSIEACTAKMDWPCHKNA